MISTEHRSMFGAKGIPAGTILGNSDQEVGFKLTLKGL